MTPIAEAAQRLGSLLAWSSAPWLESGSSCCTPFRSSSS